MRKLPADTQEERRRHVIGLRQAGLTYDTVAAQVGLTRTEVFNICTQRVEARIAVRALNRMSALGMPRVERIA